MKKSKFIFLGIVLLMLLQVDTQLLIVGAQAQTLMTQDERIKGVVEIMNQSYPRTGPNGVRVDHVSYVNKIFTFHKTYTQHTVDMFDREELRNKLPEMRTEFCSSAAMIDILKNGAIGVGNSVSDKNGILIQAFHVSKKDCKIIH